MIRTHLQVLGANETNDTLKTNKVIVARLAIGDSLLHQWHVKNTVKIKTYPQDTGTPQESVT